MERAKMRRDEAWRVRRIVRIGAVRRFALIARRWKRAAMATNPTKQRTLKSEVDGVVRERSRNGKVVCKPHPA